MSELPEADLRALQATVCDVAQRAQPLGDYPDLVGVSGQLATGNSRLSPVEQLNIYREQFWLRHIGCVREDYPTLVHLLGDEGFEALARLYLAAHPPETYTLRDVGAKLVDFVHRTEPWCDDRLLCDAARIEWAFVEAFDAPDAPPLDPQTITAATKEAWVTARLALQPAMQRVSLSYPVQELRAQVRNGENPPRPEPAPVCVVVYRGAEGTLQYIDVEPDALALLNELAAGTRLSTACEKIAAAQPPDVAETIEGRVGGWFQQWAAFGWISRVDFG